MKSRHRSRVVVGTAADGRGSAPGLALTFSGGVDGSRPRTFARRTASAARIGTLVARSLPPVSLPLVSSRRFKNELLHPPSPLAAVGSLVSADCLAGCVQPFHLYGRPLLCCPQESAV